MANRTNEAFMKGLSLTKVSSYLYDVTYSDWDYQIGSDYFEKFHAPVGACSAVRCGQYYGRNYDWYYDNCASFIVHCKSGNGKHASIGIAGGNKFLTDDVASTGSYNAAYRYLPFQTLDGINDQGVVVNVNVTAVGDAGSTTGTNPGGEDICSIMVVRYILDYADSAEHAVSLLRGLNIYSPISEEINEELHWMIADKDRTFVVETINNELKVIDTFANGMPIMTNFYLYGFDGNAATASFDSGHYDADTTTLTPHAMGVERYALLADGFADSDNKRGMINLMESVKYTKAYDRNTEPFWYSEFTGETETYGDLTIDSTAEDYDGIVSYCIGLYEDRERDGKTWQTVHSSVYNIDDRSLCVVSQEDGVEHAVKLEENADIGWVSYDIFTMAFLAKVSEYEFVQMEDFSRQSIVDGFLKSAITAFRKNCRYDLCGLADDESRTFTVSIPDDDLDEIVEIVSEGMVCQWLKPFYYRQENLENKLNTRDFTTYSPAELLMRVGNAYKQATKDYVQMIREYSYNHGDLKSLHL